MSLWPAVWDSQHAAKGILVPASCQYVNRHYIIYLFPVTPLFALLSVSNKYGQKLDLKSTEEGGCTGMMERTLQKTNKASSVSSCLIPLSLVSEERMWPFSTFFLLFPLIQAFWLRGVEVAFFLFFFFLQFLFQIFAPVGDKEAVV